MPRFSFTLCWSSNWNFDVTEDDNVFLSQVYIYIKILGNRYVIFCIKKDNSLYKDSSVSPGFT